MKLRNFLSAFAISGLAVFGIRFCTTGTEHADHTTLERDYIGLETASAATLTQEDIDRNECEARLQKLMKEPPAPGAPNFESRRAELLARAKAEPLLFVEAPSYTDEEVHITVKGLRRISSSATPFSRRVPPYSDTW